MKRKIGLMVLIALTFCVSSVWGQDDKGGKAIEAEVPTTGVAALDANVEPKTKYIPVLKYDPARNADQDIQNALAEAKRTNTRVLVEVGGLWCIWCTHMDDFFDKHPGVLAFREKYYVTVKVNYSDENKNEVLLSRYPKVAGYPHIFVLDNDGKLVHSEDTGELEEGKGYNVDKFLGFLKNWVAPS